MSRRVQVAYLVYSHPSLQVMNAPCNLRHRRVQASHFPLRKYTPNNPEPPLPPHNIPL